jgi:hypothetical protein
MQREVIGARAGRPLPGKAVSPKHEQPGAPTNEMRPKLGSCGVEKGAQGRRLRFTPPLDRPGERLGRPRVPLGIGVVRHEVYGCLLQLDFACHSRKRRTVGQWPLFVHGPEATSQEQVARTQPSWRVSGGGRGSPAENVPEECLDWSSVGDRGATARPTLQRWIVARA